MSTAAPFTAEPAARPTPPPVAGSPARLAPPASAGPPRRGPSRLGPVAAGHAERPVFVVVRGLAWAAILLAATTVGVATTAAVATVAAALAGGPALASAWGSSRAAGVAAGTRRRQLVLAGMAAAAAIPLAACAGPVAAAVTAAVGAAALAGWLGSRRPRPGLLRPLVAALGPAVGAAALVATRGQGLDEAVVLVSAVLAFDMANYVVGTPPTGGPAGAAAGAATLGVVAVAVASVLVPPFRGVAPWVLLGLVAVLAPLGVALSRWGAAGRRLPAVGRLDSLVLAGPAWVVAVHLILHR